MRQIAAASIIIGLILGSIANAGLIAQRTGGTTAPGDTMTFDLIIKNEPINPAMGETWTFDSIEPVEFSPPVALNPASPDPSFSLSPALGWDIDTLGPIGTAFFVDIGLPAITLAPMQQVHFGVLSIDFPAGFSGGFEISLAETIELVDAFNFAVVVGEADWSEQENPPFGILSPTPGGPAPSPFTISVPEPSPFLLLSLLGTLVCVRSRQKFLSQFV